MRVFINSLKNKQEAREYIIDQKKKNSEEEKNNMFSKTVKIVRN